MSVPRERHGEHRQDDVLLRYLEERDVNDLRNQGAPVAKTTSVTLTAAELFAGIITANQGGGAAATYTLPAASALETEWGNRLSKIGGPNINDAFEFSLVNISTNVLETAAIAGGSGSWATSGRLMTDAVAAGAKSSATFRVRKTGVNAFTVYNIG